MICVPSCSGRTWPATIPPPWPSVRTALGLSSTILHPPDVCTDSTWAVLELGGDGVSPLRVEAEEPHYKCHSALWPPLFWTRAENPKSRWCWRRNDNQTSNIKHQTSNIKHQTSHHHIITSSHHPTSIVPNSPTNRPAKPEKGFNNDSRNTAM
jgi:hypothetical protein